MCVQKYHVFVDIKIENTLMLEIMKRHLRLRFLIYLQNKISIMLQ